MKRRSSSRRLRTGPPAFRKVLGELLQDRQEHRLLLRGLRRAAAAHGPGYPLAGLLTNVEDVAQLLGTWIQLVRDGLHGASADTPVDAGLRQRIRHVRRWRRSLIERLPDGTLDGLPLLATEADSKRVKSGERRPVAPAGPGADVMAALAGLPKPWLLTMASCHRMRRLGGGRTRLAAHIADRLHDENHLATILTTQLDGDQRCLLARLVLAGRIAEDELDPETCGALGLGEDWTEETPPDGLWLRYHGLVLLGRHDRQRMVYVADDLRAILAFLLGAYAQEVSHDLDARTVKQLRRLGAETGKRLRREGRVQLSGDLEGVRPPTWRAGRRLPTPGPDRVLELEIEVEEQVLLVEEPRAHRRLFISYQRPVGALHQAVEVAFGMPHAPEHALLRLRPEEPRYLGAFIDPEHRTAGPPRTDEWSTSLRDALAGRGLAFRYVDHRYPGRSFLVRIVRLHAPEHVPDEPRVIGGDGLIDPRPPRRTREGVPPIEAANVFLARMRR